MAEIGGNSRGPIDDRPIWDAMYSMFTALGLLAARDLRIFERLGERPHTIDELTTATGVAGRPLQALLAVNAAAGFLCVENGSYGLTNVGARHLLEDSPGCFSGALDMVATMYAMFTPQGLVGVARKNAPAVYGQGEMFASHAQQVELARAFTQAMHGMSAVPASEWPDAIDLADARRMLDVGGGSGVHSVGAVSRWPELHATVFEMPTVCEATKEHVARLGANGRIDTHAGDMWKDPYPAADVHFYSMIFHDWPLAKCDQLARKSFEALAPGGRIVVHEMFMDEDHAGPATVAALSVSMLFGTEGAQYTAGEITAVLTRAGFEDVKQVPTCGYWSIVTGRKPASGSTTTRG